MSYKFQRPDANHAPIRDEARQLGFEVDDVHALRGLGYDLVITGLGRISGR
jgi:hypothetical protein